MDKSFSFEDLDEQGKDYKKKDSVNQSAYIYSYRYKVVRERMTGPKVLELGIGHADVTDWLSKDGQFEVTSIDGSKEVLAHAKQKISNPERVSFIHTYFEDFESDDMFDDILLNNCLEHVDDPVRVLTHIKQFLKPAGKIHITVPNAMSIHRMLGKEMGMLEREDSLNAHDIKVGHQRVYHTDLMKAHIEESGLIIIERDGIILKALSNSQMNDLFKTYGQKILDGFFHVGRRLPELASEIYFCCM